MSCVLYASVVGSLMYGMVCTRLDIAQVRGALMLGPYNIIVALILLILYPIKSHYCYCVTLHYYCYVSPNYILTP